MTGPDPDAVAMTDPLGVIPRRTARRAAEHPPHPDPPNVPGGPLALAVAARIAAARLADWRREHG